jgi:hypothetical protein
MAKTPSSIIVPPPYEAILPQRVDSTMLSCFASCPRKFFWEFVLGFRPAGVSIDLHAGACFASALENVYTEVWTRGTPLDLALARAHYKFLVQWGDFVLPEGKKTSKSIDNTWWAIEEYFKLWPPKTDHIQPYFGEDGKPTFEFTFAVPLLPEEGWPLHPVTGEPFLYSGRMDALGMYRGRPVIRDEKTTTGIGPTWASKWDLRAQFMGYIWVMQRHGMKINMVSVRGIGLLKTDIKLIEALKLFQPWMIQRWEEQTKRRLWSLVNAWNDGYFDYNFGEACTSFGNCNFMTLCKSQRPEEWFSSYTINRWDPLAVNPVGDDGDAA